MKTQSHKKTILASIFVLALSTLGSPAIADSRVIVTIKPIHGLISAVMSGIAEPALLIKGFDSVHGYQLKPSDAELVQNADVIFWVGPELETSLGNSISQLAKNSEIVELSELEGLTLLSSAEEDEDDGEEEHGDEHADEDEGEEAEEEHGDEHGHGMWDMHIWLDVDNARLFAKQAAITLRKSYPDSQEQIEANLSNVLQNLDSLEAELEEITTPVANKPYLVFHEAYQYLERKLGLNNVGSVHVNPDINPSAKKINELRETISHAGVVCMFSEPQFNQDIVTTIAEGTNVKVGLLDPLGAAVPPDSNSYYVIMKDMALSLRECLDES